MSSHNNNYRWRSLLKNSHSFEQEKCWGRTDQTERSKFFMTSEFKVNISPSKLYQQIILYF